MTYQLVTLLNEEEEYAFRDMKVEARKKCDRNVFEFAQCTRDKTFSGFIICRPFLNAMNECLSQYTGEDVRDIYRSELYAKKERKIKDSQGDMLNSFYEAVLEHDVDVDDIELEVLRLRGFKTTTARLLLSRLLFILSLGSVYLFCRWVPSAGAYLKAYRCPVDEADIICVTDEWNETVLVPVEVVDLAEGALEDIFNVYGSGHPSGAGSSSFRQIRFFNYKDIKLILNPVTKRFETILNWKDSCWGHTDNVKEGIAKSERVTNRASVFGENQINIHQRHPLGMIVDEILDPFFMFQVACMVQWFMDEYSSYGNFILVISLISMVTSIAETREKVRRLQKMCLHAGRVNVKRLGAWIEISSTELIPGDIIEVSNLEQQNVMSCDAVLLEGTCIINEYVLTGESSPISKNPISDFELANLNFSEEDPSNSRLMSRWFLFSGTKVIGVRGSDSVGNFQDSFSKQRVLALVVRTGINTTMGSLIRSILYPKPTTFKYIRDSFSYLLILTAVALICMLTTMYRFSSVGYPLDVILLRSFDLITITVPITLPATIAVGVGFSILRLQKLGIFCISAARVNVCGQVEVMCFDKTGTLTQEGLDMIGFRCVVPSSLNNPKSHFTSILSSASDAYDIPRSSETELPLQRLGRHAPSRNPNASVSFSTQDGDYRPPSDSPSTIPKIVAAMASCHSIKILNGELIGDPVDKKMFAFSGWEIDNSSSTGSDGQGFTSLVVRPSGNSDFKEALRDSVIVAMTPVSSPTTVTPTTAGSTKTFTEIGVIRSFEFGSHLRRMSVITRRLNFGTPSSSTGSVFEFPLSGPRPSKDFDVYCKGAPEVIISLCDPATVPTDCAHLLRRYAHHGYHVIAIATKSIQNMSWLKLMRMSREQVESNMEFLGFLVFENKIKPATEAVVKHLNSAKIRPIMCTGDNVLTAVSVARESGILEGDGCRVFVPRFEGDCRDADAVIVWEDVDQDARKTSNINMQLELDPVTLKPVIAIKTTDIEDPDEPQYFAPERFIEVEVKDEYQLAVSGEVFSWMLEYSDKMKSFFRMLIKAQVFARMSPEQKKQLVTSLQELGYTVGFCGDGANDWGALQAADVGVSLSEVELSVAAPFTSKYNSIACIVTLIREGRSALVTSFGSCKYMVVNSLIQCTSVLLLNTIYANLADNQFPYVDLLITVPVAIFMSESGPHATLDMKRPTSSLRSKKVIFSILGQILIQTCMQIAVFFAVRKMPFYTAPQVSVADGVYRCYESTSVFLLSTFQYLFTAIVYCDGAPYREDFWQNKRFVLTLTFLLSLSVYLTLFASEDALLFVDLATLPLEGRLLVMLFAAIDLLITSAAEVWVIPIFSKMVGWAMIEYSSYEESFEEEYDYDDGASWLESERARRRYRAIRKKWRAKGKFYKIVEQDLE
ncbi:hypothetical protein CcCBS67573_g02821 [Chytriomyces confervae]|uniref:Cation-transporting ATPase n=1 Tax=Chytriomyces confervae TaxID=246404 RepID=A0A507FJT4_9FUNG|nr:hypothetical protein CcCBS67573_g02821 [Chytriomyces confervae]